jgi:hypothetical protein
MAAVSPACSVPHWHCTMTLVPLPCFVLIYTLSLPPKCQGRCLIHAAPPTPLAHKIQNTFAGLNKFSSPEDGDPASHDHCISLPLFPRTPKWQLVLLPPQTRRRTCPLLGLSFPSCKLAPSALRPWLEQGRQVPGSGEG